jgi:hypothetical protein
MGTMMFGNDESISCIVDVELKGAQDEALCLAHKHSKLFVVAGVWVSDDGYVLGVKGKADTYYPLPPPDALKAIQADGLLPDPLPPYSLSMWDYAFGYSLWIVIGAMLLWYGGKALLFSRSSPEAAAADAPAPEPDS